VLRVRKYRAVRNCMRARVKADLPRDCKRNFCLFADTVS